MFNKDYNDIHVHYITLYYMILHDITDNTLNIEDVNLEENQLTVISSEVFSGLYRLNKLNLKDNRFICDCMMADFRLWITQVRVLFIHS